MEEAGGEWAWAGREVRLRGQQEHERLAWVGGSSRTTCARQWAQSWGHGRKVPDLWGCSIKQGMLRYICGVDRGSDWSGSGVWEGL